MKNLQNSGKEWSSADLKKLEKLADGNTPTGLIAYQLKRSEAAVYSKASDAKISLHPNPKASTKMKAILFILMSLISVSVSAQDDDGDNLSVLTKPIVEEGKRLYRSEMASWYGTDLFVANYKNQENIGGYFSYTENDVSKCIFFSREELPKVIGTISFDSTYDTKTGKIDLAERAFTKIENDLYEIRKAAKAIMESDTLFKRYNNTSLNMIPLINKDENVVYVLTGPQKTGIVIFGNDYLITFDKNNKLKTKRGLHKNIIGISYADKEEADVDGTIHTHLPETGDFITSTDICTLMLYEKFAKWQRHNVVSAKYLNIWDCKTDRLVVITMEALNKINKDIEERKEKTKDNN